MVTLLSEVHFWTTQEDVIIKHTDYGSFKYYNKKDNTDSPAAQSKKHYCEQQSRTWNLINKRPQKLRERLKELEEYLIHNRIVYFSWDENKLKLLLSTGLLVNIVINSETGDISSISFDKQLSAKLQVNIICDGTIIDNQVICICNDGHVFGFGGQWKDGWVLEGGPRRKLYYHGDWLAVWGKAGTERPQPWSPLAKDYQRANLHLYWIGARDPELLAYKKTDGEPLQVVVSKICSRTLIVVEQKVTQRGAVSAEVSNFELVGNHLKRISVTSVPLQSYIVCSSLNSSEERLLVSCIDGSLALLDRNRGSTITVKATFIPTFIAWHPDGAVVTVANDRGQIQYYDTALNCIKSQILGEDCTPAAIVDLSCYFHMQFCVASISWGHKNLVFSLEHGPMAVITHVEGSLTFKSLVQKYLNLERIDKAIKLLLSWEFNEESFFVLQKIVAHLMRQPLTDDAAQHIQNALGAFHNSPVPIKSQVRHRFGNQVYSLTRRFFHQLVRASMFEIAFLLAVDVGHHDLFMDLHYIAVKIGQMEMATAARAQASTLLSRCSSEVSNCSRSSCSQCSDSGSNSSDDYNFYNSEKENLKAPKNKTDISSFPVNPDLTSSFSQPDLVTCRPVVTTESVTTVSQVFEHSKLSFTPRATYVKAPQVPSSFTKHNMGNNSSGPSVLPFTPPLPNLPNSSIGSTPYTQSCVTLNSTFHNSSAFTYTQPKFLPFNTFYNSTMPHSTFLSNSMSNINVNSLKNTQNSNIYSAFSSSNLAVNNIKKSFTSITKVFPPLPNVLNVSQTNSVDQTAHSSTLNYGYTNNTSSALSSSSDSSSTNASAKKHQVKVKFSDTVTAFIVPEIKRPQRPPPPPHVTDPQKELADSLPLCHPNEDYLKDFAPVRKDESEEVEEGQPKIKVVHFGVV